MDRVCWKPKQSFIKGLGKLPKWPLFTHNLKQLAQNKAEDEAFVFVSTYYEREVITWKELCDSSIKVANALVDIGVKQGEVVAICIRPCPEWLYMMLGALFMGALPVNMVFTYKDGNDVIAFMERLGNCSFVAIDPGYEDENIAILTSLLDEVHDDGRVRSKVLPFLRYVIAHHPAKRVTGMKQLTEWYSEKHPEACLPEIGPNDTAFLFQTSGSTGVPKIIAQSFNSLHSWEELFETMQSKRFFNDRPFGWVGGFPFNIDCGVTRVAVSGFSPPPSNRARFVTEVIKKEKCDSAILLPQLMAEISLQQERTTGPLLRSVMTGGHPLAGSIARYVGSVCDTLFLVYGGTESSVVSLHRQMDNNTYRDYMCGKLYPEVEVKIVDTSEATLPVNERGEIYVRSPFNMKEVYGDAAKTREVITEDGWLRTGDIGRIDDNDQLFVEGRKSNEVIRGGMSITAEYLEAALRRCPDIKDAIITPVPHPTLYQEICACIILKTDSLAHEADIRKFCEDMYADKQRVFTYLPDHYMILDRFPETSTGKPSRSLLKDKAKSMFEQK